MLMIGNSHKGFKTIYDLLIFDLGLLTRKTVPYGAGYRLPAGKHTGILTYFQTKIKGKISWMLDA